MKRFFQNTLISVLSYNAILVVVRFFTSFIAIKAMAIFVGPGGIALIGNFRSFLTGIQSLASFGIREGVVKFVAEKKEHEPVLKKVISTAMRIVLVFSVLVSIGIFLGAHHLNDYLFPKTSYAHIFKLLAFLLPLSVMNIFLLAILNGFETYKKIIFINSLANIFGLGLTLFLMWKFAIEGALIAAIIGEAGIIALTVLFSRKQTLKYLSFLHYSNTYTHGFLQYSLMALTTAIVLPLSFILVRNHIIHHLSLHEAGYWEALQRISGMYMIFVTSGLALYYFPRLAALKTKTAFTQEVVNYYKTLVPAFLVMILCVYGLKKWIVLLVLNEEFIAITSIIGWQLLGDLLKVMSLAFGYQILAKSMVRRYIFIEILFGTVFYLLSIYFIELSGLSGVVQAHFAANLINFACMLFLFRKTVRSLFSKV